MAELDERFDELCAAVLAPLVLGGPIHPVRPFGAKLALAIGRDRAIRDAELASRIDVARVRRARLLEPIDAVEELDAWDFALAAGFNDLLQLTNHALTGPFTRGRTKRLLANVAALASRVPAPATASHALARHATFARVFEVARTDRVVHWWTGSARFRGEPPPSRLLAWKELRRVRVDATQVALEDMLVGALGVPADAWIDALALWLTRSPLTDLATLGRAAPKFAWSRSTLSLVATPAGRTMAFRAIASLPLATARAALDTATRSIPARYEEARRVAEAFASDATRALEALGAKGA